MSHRSSILATETWKAAGAAVVLALALPALADCVDGMREPRAAEREFHDRAQAALTALLPPLPPGITSDQGPVGVDQAPKLGSVCKEVKEGQFNLLVRRSYLLAPDDALVRRHHAQRQALSDQMAELRKLPPDALAEQSRITAQVDQLEGRRMQMLRNKEDAAADALYRNEIKPLNDRYHAIRLNHIASVKPQTDPLQAQWDALEARPQKAWVALAINQARLPKPGSAPVVGSEGVDAPNRNQDLKVVNVAWAVMGDEGPLRNAIAAALAVDRVRALVGRPLPSIEQSRAWVAQLPVPAMPQAVAAPPAPAPAAAQAVAQAPAAVPTAAPVPAAAPTPKPAASTADAGKGDAIKKAAEGIQKLRGLLGR